MPVRPDTTDPHAATDRTVVLSEYESASPIALSERARAYLRDEINGGSDRGGDRVDVSYTPDGNAVLTATSYVGLVGLPDGPTLEIRPKIPSTNLLYALQYASAASAHTFDTDTRIEAGTLFVDALGILYERELQRVRNRGLHTDYVTRQSVERRLRGRLDVQRQIQRHPPVPTEFECTYEELTPDIPINQAILRVTEGLLRMVSGDQLTGTLRRHARALRRDVSRTHITHADVAAIKLDRLNEHYERILRLTKLFLRNSHVGDVTSGSRRAFSLLVNMNEVFESVVSRAAEAAVADRKGWRIVRQDASKRLLHDGRFDITLKPDFTVRDASGTVRLVGDAKWKRGAPPNADFYQIAAYQRAHAAPSVLVYPSQGGAVADACTIADGHPLRLLELPTSDAYASYAEFRDAVTEAMTAAIDEAIE
ncbi:McrC family protein [Haloparvum alkalitolerans]|uniref:McrC family protein n=1 Tax=Haloparvum alkalitolerans TaxID=1042953 RepID=UPI003CEED179